MIEYKNFQDENICSSVSGNLLDSQDQNDPIETQSKLQQICNKNSISSIDDMKILYDYCKNSCIDDFGVNLFLFKLVFYQNIDDNSDLNIIHLLMETLQLSSFNPDFFLDAEYINCLIDQILNHIQLSKYALIFFINLLYKTDKRKFLKETNFFNMFQEKETDQQNFEQLIFAFFSQSEEIDQEMFNILNQYISQYSFSTIDSHQKYRYLIMILSLAEKNIKINNIDALINDVLDLDEDFMVEITLFLIQYSDNPQNFFDYIVSNFEKKFDNTSIILAAIRTFNFCWSFFNQEQKISIAQIISLKIPEMPYSLRLACVSFICNAESWDIFNNIIFFDEILNLISQKEVSMKCLEAISHILSTDCQDNELNLQKINLLLSHYEDLSQIANSAEEPENRIAQLLIDVLNEDD